MRSAVWITAAALVLVVWGCAGKQISWVSTPASETMQTSDYDQLVSELTEIVRMLYGLRSKLKRRR